MKTLKLKLKKEVLMVDESDFDYYEIFEEGIYFRLENGDREFIEGQFFILGKGSELTEEIASDIFEHDDFLNRFEAYIDTVPSIDKSALKLFIKIFESKGFYWLKNPIEKSYYNLYKGIYEYEPTMQNLQRIKDIEKWQEAEEKTFRNPLIFVKNA